MRMNESETGLDRVLAAWKRSRFPQRLATFTESTDALFSEATDAQRADYRERRERHMQGLIKLIESGAPDDILLAEARAFYSHCLTMPRRPAPMPTPESEIARCAEAMTSRRLRCPYRGPELDAIAYLLGKEPVGTEIAGWTERSISFSTGTIIQRRDLKRANCPSAMTRFDKHDAQFPDPSEYEIDAPSEQPEGAWSP